MKGVNRVVPREEEVVEFRPIPGQEEDWAGFQFVDRSRLWEYLGIYPIGGYLVLCAILLGASI